MKKIQLRTMAAVFGGVVLCVLLPFGSTLADVIVGVSPDEAVKFADVIVVGKLTDIEKRVFSLTTTKFGPALKPPTVWYDVGLIKDPRFLKGERLHNRVPQEREIRRMILKQAGKDYSDAIEVAFVSSEQVRIDAFLGPPHSAGENGI